VVWAAVELAFSLFHSAPFFSEISFQTAAAVPSAFVAMLMVMALYEEEKRRVERNMLALSNLNLATSSFVGGEIQRMLAQALDRVLGVVRLPAGALFLHHGDPQGPTSVVAVGLNDDFCRVAQNEGLDDYLVSLVARLGGLLGFRDLRNSESVAALERDKIAGAALDVHENEPFIHPGLRRPNVILTPHIASASLETRTKMACMAAENVIAVFQGRTPPNMLNPEVLQKKQAGA